jgi:hypothetical protein
LPAACLPACLALEQLGFGFAQLADSPAWASAKVACIFAVAANTKAKSKDDDDDTKVRESEARAKTRKLWWRRR